MSIETLNAMLEHGATLQHGRVYLGQDTLGTYSEGALDLTPEGEAFLKTRATVAAARRPGRSRRTAEPEQWTEQPIE